MNRDPHLLTTSTNRNLLQPTKDNRRRRKSDIRESINKGKDRSVSRGSGGQRNPIESKLRNDLSPSPSRNNDRSQLVDLVVEDTQAEEAERVRARKEGGDAWNQSQQKQFVRTYSVDSGEEGDIIREGFDPSKIPAAHPPPERAVSDSDEDEDEDGEGSVGHSTSNQGRFGSLVQEDNVWK